MSTPVWVEQVNGHFTASLLGRPEVRADGPTREAALAAVRVVLADRRPAGELVWLEDEPAGAAGVAEIARKYANDPGWHDLWDQIKRDAYRERDEEKAREFPE